jgi:dihydrofolate synthase/folylpolyglutamate synthase
MNNINFFEFLNNKTLYYDKIDFKTIKNSWEKLSSYIKLPYVIHIVGTNGKGTTGRYIASSIYQNKKNVIHYSSPHIIDFNERIWINGKNSSNQQLQNAHKHLLKILDNDLLEKLTYFEYTTLICLYMSSNMDYIVLEAGLGGEFDATNVVKNDLTVVPSVGLDHVEFLGNTIKKIATTKLKSCDSKYILGIDIHKDVLEVKDEILQDKIELRLDQNIALNNISVNLPLYLKNNLILAMNVIQYLKLDHINIVIDEVFGRCQKIENNITVDVGHNVLAANVIKKEFINKKIILIYNSYKDKNYASILEVLKDIIIEVQVIDCIDERMCSIQDIERTIKNLNIKVKKFNFLTMKNDTEYLVFGSFKVVETFLLMRNKNN